MVPTCLVGDDGVDVGCLHCDFVDEDDNGVDIGCLDNFVDGAFVDGDCLDDIQVEANVDPSFTCLVWQKLEQQVRDQSIRLS